MSSDQIVSPQCTQKVYKHQVWKRFTRHPLVCSHMFLLDFPMSECFSSSVTLQLPLNPSVLQLYRFGLHCRHREKVIDPVSLTLLELVPFTFLWSPQAHYISPQYPFGTYGTQPRLSLCRKYRKFCWEKKPKWQSSQALRSHCTDIWGETFVLY